MATAIVKAGAQERVEKLTATPTDLLNGYLTLSTTPGFPTRTLVDYLGGCSQDYGVDFTVSGNRLYFAGLGLETILGVGNSVRVAYFI